MSYFPGMEWNGKWEWENMMNFGSKASESPKELQLTGWGLEDEGEIDAGSFNLSGGGCGSGHSGSDQGNGSSGKSSISVSVDSSAEDGTKTSSFGFEASRGTFPPLEAVEPLIGLGLGKRAHFENNCSGGNTKSPSSVIPQQTTTAMKKAKPPSPCVPIPRCQVEGCNLDLTSSKDYHRKHKVCDSHSKCPKVIVGGVERRFCQQCSRFHSLSEFDEKKRSCRKRLSDHNARRRKPQQETIQFNSSRLPSIFDGRQQMNFVVTNGPITDARNASYLDWESSRSSKFTITRGFPFQPGKTGGMLGQAQKTGNQPSHIMTMHDNPSNGLLELKNAGSPVFNQGFKDSVFSSDAAHRALSLLSTSSWGSLIPESLAPEKPRSNMPQSVRHGTAQALPFASSEIWPNPQQPAYPPVHTVAPNSYGSAHLEGIQVFRAPYETDFYQSSLN